MKNQGNTKDVENNFMAGRLVNFRPIFMSVLFLVFGILCAYFRIVEERTEWWLLAVLAATLPLPFFFFVKNKNRYFAALSALYFCFFLGSTSFALSVSRFEDVGRYDYECYVVGTVVEKNVEVGGGEIILADLTIDGNSEQGRLTVSVYDNDFTALEFCDIVRFRMRVSTSTKLTGKYGFRAEAIADGEIFYGSNVTWYEVQGRAFKVGAYLRGKLQNALYTAMGDEGAAVATAILLGNTSGIESGLLENVRYGGVAHIFAVSGLHVGAVFAFCLALFRGNRIPAPIRFVLVALILLLYGGVCGYSASIVRAIITCLVLYGCSLLGIKYDSLESLSAAAFIVFLAYPTLTFGVGAQLSFGACLGILLLSNPLQRGMGKGCKAVASFVRKRILKRPEPRAADMFRGNTSPKPLAAQAVEKVVAFLSVSLAAQLGTAPILYLSFGYFSVISIFLNCIYVPLITLCFSGLLLLAVLSAIFPIAAGVLLYVPNLLINVAVLPFHALAFSGGVINSVTLSGGALVCYYGGVLFLSDKFNLPKWQKGLTVSIFFAAFTVCVFAAG